MKNVFMKNGVFGVLDLEVTKVDYRYTVTSNGFTYLPATINEALELAKEALLAMFDLHFYEIEEYGYTEEDLKKELQDTCLRVMEL